MLITIMMDRFTRRMKTLREHHKKQEIHYNQALTIQNEEEHKKTLQLFKTMEKPKPVSAVQPIKKTTEKPKPVSAVQPIRRTDEEDSDDHTIDLDEEHVVSSSESEYEPESDSSSVSSVQPWSSLTLTSTSEHEKGTSTSPKKSPKITVKYSTKTAEGNRVWNKKQFCLYCKKPNSKLARHLERKHSAEVEVARALSFQKGSKRRLALLEEIRNKGNYEHNVEVLQKGEGQLITWRQPESKSHPNDYLPCPHCWGFFVKTDLWKHEASCRVKKEKNIKKRKKIQSCASHLLPVSTSASEGCKEILHNMQQDAISFCIKKDPLICKFGDVLFEKHGQNKFQHIYISQKMRELGRFLIAARDIDKTIHSLQEVLVPGKFQTVIKATRKASGFMAEQNEYKTPSLACKIGYSLKRAAQILVGECLMNGQKNKEQDAKLFIELMETQWNTYISGRALHTLKTARWNKDEMIPLTEDIMKMQKHLKVLETEAVNELSHVPSVSAWKKLCQSLLTQIILFNRRREGEASKLLLATYKNRNKAPAHPEIFNTLSKLEKSLVNNFTRLEIRGKRDRKVPLLLTHDMESSLDILIKHRSAVGVSEENPYVFARISGTSNIRGSDCLRHFAAGCHAKHPERLTSTKLRKHIATLCQMMNLKKSEMDQVAKFMGHDIRVHREYYRLSENTIQLAKISKLLIAIEQGNHTYLGRSLEEVELDDLASQTKGISSDGEKSDIESSSEGSKEVICSQDQSKIPAPTECKDKDIDTSYGKLKLRDKPDLRQSQRKKKRRRFQENVQFDEDEDADVGNDDRSRGGTSGPQSRAQSRRPWSTEEKNAVWRHMSKYLGLKRVPNKDACILCIQEEPDLKNRSWKDIKNFVYNTLQSKHRKAAAAMAKTEP